MSRRRKTSTTSNGTPNGQIRCAIYTRKSSEEGLDQEFNSLDAQRESAEAFIASQKAEGWTVLDARYDDGGFSGGSMERPALDRLLRDIEAGKIDCVVVYKVDRLSRSLLDFSRIMETFENHGVSFVSVTQQFNTTHSMGRLTLNILLSFAQFEREIIGERIRDKIAAQKRKGKWAGGVPVLGYDVDRSGPSPRLVVNAKEAARVREIFRLYLEKESLLAVVTTLREKGWANKRRVTKTGKQLGGRQFDKATLHHLLVNPVLIGKIKHIDTLYDGEHDPIVDVEVFNKVQALLKSNGRSGGVEVRNKYGALLRGLIRCKACGTSMTHTFSGDIKRKKKAYRYYRCTSAIKNGRGVCDTGTVPAQELERIVVDEVRGLATDKSLLKQVLAEAHETIHEELDSLRKNRDEQKRELTRFHRELRQLITKNTTSSEATARMAELQQGVTEAEQRLPMLDDRIAELERETVSRGDAEAAFADFDALWSNLSPREQARLLKLLISVVDYDAKAGTIAVTFRPSSIAALARKHLEEAA